MGEWDASSATEPFAAQEYNVARIFVHPQYTAANLRNDIAILRLSSPVILGQVRKVSFVSAANLSKLFLNRQFPTITTACLPNSLVSFYSFTVAKKLKEIFQILK